MPPEKCLAAAPQMRESVGELSEMLERANQMADIICDKLFGSNLSENCEKVCPPNTVQNGIDRSRNMASILISKLDEIGCRL